MKLTKTTFNELEIGDDYVNMNSEGLFNHWIKTCTHECQNKRTGAKFPTGQYHTVWKIVRNKKDIED